MIHSLACRAIITIYKIIKVLSFNSTLIIIAELNQFNYTDIYCNWGGQIK
jgi:hypothetical protein